VHDDPTRVMGQGPQDPGNRPHGNVRLLVAGLVAVIVGLLIAIFVIADDGGDSGDAGTAPTEATTLPTTTDETTEPETTETEPETTEEDTAPTTTEEETTPTTPPEEEDDGSGGIEAP
jgi:hypothetical protein